MRVAEWVHVCTFSYFFAVLALQWSALPGARRRRILVLGIAGLAVTLGGKFSVPEVRDWIPAGLMLVVYQQAGAFFVRVDHGFQDVLLRIDARWSAPVLQALARSRGGRLLTAYCELAYLLCYAMIPMSLGALYALHRRESVDLFWGVVLTSTYLCYATLPFLQAMPPRVLGEKWVTLQSPGPVRRLNLWLLRNGSIHANTFPSVHAAASVAAALVLVTAAPSWVAAVFAAIALGITAGTCIGRYHYCSDALLGFALAAGVFAVRITWIR